MIGIVLIFIVAGIMKKIVEMDGEPGMKWALISVGISVALSFLIGTFFAAPASLLITYGILVVKKVKAQFNFRYSGIAGSLSLKVSFSRVKRQ